MVAGVLSPKMQGFRRKWLMIEQLQIMADPRKPLPSRKQAASSLAVSLASLIVLPMFE
jgi:hypothetical protein